MTYGAYEVVTYGGGETLRDTFISVALLAGGGPIDSAFRVAALTGLLILLLKAVFDLNLGALLRWFLMAAVIYGVIWIPRVQVHVTDRFNPTLTGADIAHVPLGIAFVAATTSEIGDAAIDVSETAFGDPAGMSYSGNGMIYGAKLFADMQAWQVLDSNLALTLQGFMTNCVAPDILSNNLVLDRVENTADLWGYLAANPNPAAQTADFLQGGGALVACPTAANDITGAFPSEIAQNEAARQRRLQPAFATANLQPSIAQALNDYGSKMFSAGTSDQQLFRQVLTITALRQSVGAYAALAPGSTALQNFGYFQGQNQITQGAGQLGAAAQKAIPILQLVMLVLFIGMFPIMAPAFLLPAVGPRMLQTYLGGFLYLQLWGPMYVLLNKLFNYVTLQQGAAAAWTPPGSSAYAGQAALTFQNLVGVASTHQQISNVAGMMMLSIPVLAAAMTKGAMEAGGHVGQFLGGLRSTAEGAGQMVATRNISLGQTALDTVQFANASANQVRTSAYVDTGAFTSRAADGGFVTHAANGSMIVQSGLSQPGFDITTGRAISQEARRAAMSEHRQGQEISKAYSKAETQTRSAILESYQARSQGNEARHSKGQDARAGVSEAASTLMDLQSHLQRSFGLSAEVARNYTSSLAGSVGGGVNIKGGVGIPKVGVGGGVDGHIAGNLTQTWRLQGSDGERASAILTAGRQFLEREDFSAKVDRARQSFATDNYAAFEGSSRGSRTASSRVFANAESVERAVRESEGRSRSYSEAASRAESLSLDERTRLTQGAVDFLYRTAPGKQGLYGQPLGREDMVQLMNPTGADAAQWTELRTELLRPWLKDQADVMLRDAAPILDLAPREDLGPGGGTEPLVHHPMTAAAAPSERRRHGVEPPGALHQGPVSSDPIPVPEANWTGALAPPTLHLSKDAGRASDTARTSGAIAVDRTRGVVKKTGGLDRFDHGRSNAPMDPDDP